ncbi:MAG: HAD-IA family hydrolase [Phycisphaerae bacterium]|nr:HAD-IA family hydrolase [Phycisphaerae bacterium]
MARPIIMPQVGQDIETGAIVEWRVKENDYVNKGDVVAVVESDKATFEVEAYESGVVLKILYDAGAEVKVLDPIAYVGEPGEIIEAAKPTAETTTEVTPSRRARSKEETERSSKPGVSVSPSARRVARQHDIDLSTIEGTGPDGRILKQDVLAAISSTGPDNERHSMERAKMKALIFDCDGVLVDTERDGHRVAFNKAFAEKGYDIEWNIKLYGKLLEVAGGKERMRHYFDNNGWPADAADKDALIKELHKLKTDLFMQIIESGELPLRPGVARLVDEAIAANVTLAICSTSNERAVNLVAEKLLGPERKARFSEILAGDVVSRKKPDPEVYNLASQRLGVEPSECIVVEDSRNGLLAAKAANMCCVVTTNGYTKNEDFEEADLVVCELGDPPNVQVTLEAVMGIVDKG